MRFLPVITLAAATVAGCGIQDHLLYFPDRTRPDRVAAGLRELQEVTLAAPDGLALVSWWLPPRDGRPVIAYFHGNGGHIGYRAVRLRRFAVAGLSGLMLEYRGYGGNPGRPGEEGLYNDGRAALAFLDRTGIAPERRVLYGESLGAAVAVQMAIEHRAGAVILEAPFTRLADAAAVHYPEFLVALVLRDRFDLLARIGAVQAPLLVLHGERDSIVPVALGRELFAAANQPKEAWFAAGGGHNDLREHGALEVALAFIRRWLG